MMGLVTLQDTRDLSLLSSTQVGHAKTQPKGRKRDLTKQTLTH
jgi:hypothetical protein